MNKSRIIPSGCNVFSRGIPTAFIVASPFQLLCAIEAIHEFEVEEYKVVLVLLPNWPRNEQLISMVKMYNLVYDEARIIAYDREIEYSHSSGNTRTTYPRLMLGDYMHLKLYKVAGHYSSTGTVIFYGDDGLSSILYYRGISKETKPSTWGERMRWERNSKGVTDRYRNAVVQELEEKGVIFSNCFYTVYSKEQTNKFYLYSNDLSFISTFVTGTKEVVVIVGGIISGSYDINHVPTSEMECIYERKICEIRGKYPSSHILFIPHGRDTNTRIIDVCKENNIEYKRIDECLESFFVKSDYKPIAVYGQGSSALYNMKLIYGESTIISWFLDKKRDNPNYKVEKIVVDYFLNNGINIEVIKYPKPTVFEWFNSLKDNILSLLPYCLRNAIMA